MLVDADTEERNYRIAINNSSGYAELVADFSYLANVPAGTLSFDFTHMAAPLTQAKLDMHLPSEFGYQPTHLLMEVVAAISGYVEDTGLSFHRLVARLPDTHSRVGRFLADMHLYSLLAELGIEGMYANPSVTEMGDDDTTRRNLIPLTTIKTEPFSNLIRQVTEIRTRIEAIFGDALPENCSLASCFTSIVSEAVDNLIEYGQGGIIGGLYYPRVGEVEITLVNRSGGFGGETPDEQLEAMVRACEGETRRANGGGNGISGLLELSETCFGTLVLRNGNASVRFGPDGSVAGTTEVTELPALGASVTLLLQLLPSAWVERTQPMRAFEDVLAASLSRYQERREGEHQS